MNQETAPATFVTRTMAEWAAKVAYEDLPAEVIATANRKSVV